MLTPRNCGLGKNQSGTGCVQHAHFRNSSRTECGRSGGDQSSFKGVSQYPGQDETQWCDPARGLRCDAGTTSAQCTVR